MGSVKGHERAKDIGFAMLGNDGDGRSKAGSALSPPCKKRHSPQPSTRRGDPPVRPRSAPQQLLPGRLAAGAHAALDVQQPALHLLEGRWSSMLAVYCKKILMSKEDRESRFAVYCKNISYPRKERERERERESVKKGSRDAPSTWISASLGCLVSRIIVRAVDERATPNRPCGESRGSRRRRQGWEVSVERPH